VTGDGGEIVRLLRPRESDNGNEPGAASAVDAAAEAAGPLLVHFLQVRRRALIQELREIDSLLVTVGALKHETLQRRVR